jgi:hypothetical protein
MNAASLLQGIIVVLQAAWPPLAMLAAIVLVSAGRADHFRIFSSTLIFAMIWTNAMVILALLQKDTLLAHQGIFRAVVKGLSRVAPSAAIVLASGFALLAAWSVGSNGGRMLAALLIGCATSLLMYLALRIWTLR